MFSKNLSSDEKKLKEVLCARSLIAQTMNAAQVFWLYMPVSLSDGFKSEMLLVNSVVIGYYPRPENLVGTFTEALAAAPDKSKILVLLNLDKYVQAIGARSLHEIRNACRNLSRKFKDFPMEKLLVHTGYLDKSLKEIFFEQNIFLIQKNLSDDKVAGPLLQKLIPVFLSESLQERRSYIRVMPDEEIRTRIEWISGAGQTQVSGLIEDMGLAGLSVSIPSEGFEKMNVRDMLRVQVWLPRNVIRIDTAVVTWKREGLNQVGLYFDAQDPRMISPEHAATLSYYILLQIKMARKLLNSDRDVRVEYEVLGQN